MTSNPTDPGPSPAETPRRRRRWRAILWRTGAIAAAVFLLVTVVVSQTGVARYAVLPKIEAMINADIEARRVIVGADGSIVLRDARFLNPALDGEPAEFFAVREARIWIDWTDTLGAGGRVTRVVLDGPRLRLSQDQETDAFNIAGISILDLAGDTPTGQTPDLPVIEANNGVVQMCEHTGEKLRVLGQIPFEGALAPAVLEGVAGYTIEARADEGTDSPLVFNGSIDPDGVELVLRTASLGGWSDRLVPTRYQAQYRALDPEGAIEPVTFRYNSGGSFEVVLSLQDVGINLPIGPGGTIAQENLVVRMTNAQGRVDFAGGTISATLAGLIDGHRFDALLSYEGLGLDSPFLCELTSSFRLEDENALLVVAPDEVIKQLELFSNPTADLRADMVFSRDTPGGPLQMSGEINFWNGTASYSKLPYVFHDLSGAAIFSNNSLRLTGIKGQSAAGAVLNATGTIAPLGPTSEVELDITIDALPVDDEFRAGLGDRRKLIDALFNKTRAEELADEGLIDPDTFDLGGLWDVTLRLHRDEGRVSKWNNTVSARLGRGGVAPEHFPLPMIAEGVTIEVGPGGASLSGGVYRGLDGGEATIEASLPKNASIPSVTITGVDLPADDRLAHAIDRASPIGKGGGGGESDSLRGVLDRLGLEGSIAECRAEIGPDGNGRTRYHINADLSNLTARPAPDPGNPAELVLDNFSGEVTVNQRSVRLSLLATAATAQGVTPSDRPFSVDIRLDAPHGGHWGDPVGPGRDPRPRLQTAVGLRSIHPDLPLDQLVRIFSPDAGEAIRGVVDTYSPSGLVTIRGRIIGRLGEAPGVPEPEGLRAELSLSEADDLSLTLDGRPVGLAGSVGSVSLVLGADPRMSADGFVANLLFEGSPSGSLRLSGELPLLAPGAAPPAGDRLNITLEDAAFGSPLTGWLVSSTLSPAQAEAFRSRHPEGRYTVRASLGPDPDRWHEFQTAAGSASSPAFPPVRPEIELRPHSLAIDHAGIRIDAPDITGALLVDRDGGRLDGLRVVTDAWGATIHGSWTAVDDGSITLDATTDLDADALVPSLLALLPPELIETAEALSLEVDGPVRSRGLRLRLEGLDPETGRIGRVLSKGRVAFEGLSATPGLTVRDGAGEIDIWADRRAGERPRYDLGVTLSRARVAGVRATDASVRIVPGAEPGSVEIPVIEGAIHGGAAAGAAVLSPPSGPDNRRALRTDLRLSNILVAPALDDLQPAPPPTPTTASSAPADDTALSPTEPTEWANTTDDSRGRLDAALRLESVAGDPDSRVGRGTVAVRGGRIVELPLLVRLFEVTSLSLPVGERVSSASAELFLKDDRVVFESITARSPSVEIYGSGDMRWPATDLNLRFRTRPTAGLPFIADLVRGVRNELATVRVTGTPPNIEYQTDQFSGSRGVLRALMGSDDTSDRSRLDTIDARAQRRPGPMGPQSGRRPPPLDPLIEDEFVPEPVEFASEPVAPPIGED